MTEAAAAAEAEAEAADSAAAAAPAAQEATDQPVSMSKRISWCARKTATQTAQPYQLEADHSRRSSLEYLPLPAPSPQALTRVACGLAG